MSLIKDLWMNKHLEKPKDFHKLYIVVDTESDAWECTEDVLQQGRDYGMYTQLEDALLVRDSYKNKESFKIFVLAVGEIAVSSSESEQKVG